MPCAGCSLPGSRRSTSVELETQGPADPVVAEGLEGTLSFFTDLCHIQAARAAGEVGRICAEFFVWIQPASRVG